MAWNSYGDMWRERDAQREADQGEYQPIDPKKDTTPFWLRKASKDFDAYPTAPAPAPEPPRTFDNGLVAPWADAEEVPSSTAIQNPWADRSEPGEVTSSSGLRDPWAEPRSEGFIVRNNPYGAPTQQAQRASGGSGVRAAGEAFKKAYSAVAGADRPDPRYRAPQEQNVEITGARFRTAEDGSVFFRGADGAEYQMNPADPNVQRAMAYDARQQQPPQRAPADHWQTIRGGR